MVLSEWLRSVLLWTALICALTNKDPYRSLPGCSERFHRFSSYCLKSQQEIIKALETLETEAYNSYYSLQSVSPATFQQDPWQSAVSSSSLDPSKCGFGTTAVIKDGTIFEKGAVSTTMQSGKLSKERALAISSRSSNSAIQAGDTYYAAALSLVLHSKSPMVPTFRSDVRYFEVSSAKEDERKGTMNGWFGGGADLTPYYLFDEDAHEFHGFYKKICDRFSRTPESQSASETLFTELKRTCDEYFYIPSRGEHRGIGGIFFDDLTSLHYRHDDEHPSDQTDIERAMAFTCSVCDGFVPSYLPIVRRRHSLPYTEAQRHWQLLRRGRYVEFNLLFDRGVRFGLVPGGRTEAVLVSCPPLVAWDYNHQPSPGGEEERLMEIFTMAFSSSYIRICSIW
jgi:coproporphyrinogen III oxidase